MTTSDAQECVTKVCTKCGKQKPKKLFKTQSQRKDGISSICKECCAASDRKYRPPAHGLIVPRRKANADSERQRMVVKYGYAVVEAMEQTPSENVFGLEY